MENKFLLILIAVGIGLLGYAIYIKVKEKTSIISGLKISEKVLEKHKNYIANEYGNAMIVVAVSFIVSGGLMIIFNNTITLILSFVVVLAATSRLSSVRNYLVNKKYK